MVSNRKSYDSDNDSINSHCPHCFISASLIFSSSLYPEPPPLWMNRTVTFAFSDPHLIKNYSDFFSLNSQKLSSKLYC